MLVIAERHGMATSHHEYIDGVLKERRRADAASVRRRAGQLAKWGVAPKIPQDITAPGLKPLPTSRGVKRVATVKVTEHQDRRKRELGDEGESWALAAIIATFTSLSPKDRGRAIDDVTDLVNGESTGVRFESATGSQKNGSVEAILAHAGRADLRFVPKLHRHDERLCGQWPLVVDLGTLFPTHRTANDDPVRRPRCTLTATIPIHEPLYDWVIMSNYE